MSNSIVLENQYMRVELSERGRMISLQHKADGGRELIEAPTPRSFFMNLADECCKEILVMEEKQEIVARGGGERASFTIERLVTEPSFEKYGVVDISLTLHVALEGDSLLFTADVDNRTDMYVLDFEYPCVGAIKSLGAGKPTLYWPVQPGFLIMNAGELLTSEPPHRENGSNARRLNYPGGAMVGLYGLMDAENSLFISTEDPDFVACELKVIGLCKNPGAMLLSVDKHLCCKNKSVHTAPVRMRLYRGDWHYAASAYADWIRPYRKTHDVPRWIREMKGYFLVINKQQFGYEAWSYDKLPRLYELALAHGCDTLGLFGWYHTGHDNNYPNIDVSPTLGGEETLRENIKKVQAAGGHVTLYHQGHLIDVLSDFYRNGDGKRVEAKTIWGSPYSEFYPKSHRSDFLALYSKRAFSLACPSCPEWVELMLDEEKKIGALGADAALYDQIGGMSPYPCFAEGHPHVDDDPARAFSHGQTELVKALQAQSKRISEDFGFMSEHFTDLYSAHLDMVHSCRNFPGAEGEHRRGIGDEQGKVTFPDLHRYAFPDTVITARNAYPYQSRRRVNYNFLYQFIPEMEIRYREDSIDVLEDTFREERLYAAAVSALREKHIHALAHGRYTDTDGIRNTERELLARGFAYDGALYVTLWNDSDRPITPSIEVAGKTLACFETPDGAELTALRELPSQSIALAIYR